MAGDSDDTKQPTRPRRRKPPAKPQRHAEAVDAPARALAEARVGVTPPQPSQPGGGSSGHHHDHTDDPDCPPDGSEDAPDVPGDEPTPDQADEEALEDEASDDEASDDELSEEEPEAPPEASGDAPLDRPLLHRPRPRERLHRVYLRFVDLGENQQVSVRILRSSAARWVVGPAGESPVGLRIATSPFVNGMALRRMSVTGKVVTVVPAEYIQTMTLSLFLSVQEGLDSVRGLAELTRGTTLNVETSYDTTTVIEYGSWCVSVR